MTSGSKLNLTTMEKIKLTFDYYGDKEYGKRVFWVSEDSFVWLDDIMDWAKKVKEKGDQFEITNPEDVNPDTLKRIMEV